MLSLSPPSSPPPLLGTLIGRRSSRKGRLQVMVRMQPLFRLLDLRDIALMQVMRDGMLRVSEARELLVGDFTSEPDETGRLAIRRSKTDQEGAGAILYLRRNTAKALRQTAVA